MRMIFTKGNLKLKAGISEKTIEELYEMYHKFVAKGYEVSVEY